MLESLSQHYNNVPEKINVSPSFAPPIFNPTKASSSVQQWGVKKHDRQRYISSSVCPGNHGLVDSSQRVHVPIRCQDTGKKRRGFGADEINKLVLQLPYEDTHAIFH